MKNNNETLHIERTLQKAIMAAFRLADDHDQLPPSTTCAGRKHAGPIPAIFVLLNYFYKYCDDFTQNNKIKLKNN